MQRSSFGVLFLNHSASDSGRQSIFTGYRTICLSSNTFKPLPGFHSLTQGDAAFLEFFGDCQTTYLNHPDGYQANISFFDISVEPSGIFQIYRIEPACNFN
jgi:hypothetical protein